MAPARHPSTPLRPFFSILMLIWGLGSCRGSLKFGYDLHHLYSEPVRAILSADGLPAPGTSEYYAAMAHRDRAVSHRRKLVGTGDPTRLTFQGGNETYLFDLLGYLHYTNISVGTPSKSFLVALDTGSDLLWLPCDCISCVYALRTSAGEELELNIYSRNASSTSMGVPCNSPLCSKRRCSSPLDTCPYQVVYLSNGTSSTGALVEDVLHFVSEDNQSRVVDARIMFGCGRIQTGSFLQGAAPNGLLGLGMSNISVPSFLAKQGLVSNSFSMCFGIDGVGRITFGDEGSSDQEETPFSSSQQSIYNVSITQIAVGQKIGNISFTAVFDSGTSFTYLTDPAYTLIAESFHSQTQEKRYIPDRGVPFKYCYELSEKQTNFSTPDMILTMKGGKKFSVSQPVVLISDKDSQDPHIYCLGLAKSGDVDIIGQNFMTGYRIVFNRDRRVLGWKESNCYDSLGSTTLPINPRNSTAIPPAVTFDPVATSGTSNGSHSSAAPPLLSSYMHCLYTLSCLVVMISFLFVPSVGHSFLV